MKSPEKFIRIRILLVGCFLSLFFTVIIVKAVYLQVFRGHWLAQKAASQYELSIVTYGKRGTIYDAKGNAMAVSVDVPSIAAFPSQIKNPRTAAPGLAKALGEKQADIHEKLTSKRTFTWVKRHVSPKEAKGVKALGIEGLGFIPESSRFYPQKTFAAQVLGFTGVDEKGLEGVEFFYDSHLKGAAIEQTILRDALGRGFEVDKKIVSAFSGRNLVLTIDGTIQYISEKVLAETVARYSAKSAIAVVMDPKTGAILAIAHHPSFNPNSYGRFRKDHWRNRAATDPFEPGSTMKIFSAAAALESGIISPNSIFFCENGKYRIGKNVVHDVHAYGWLSLQQIVKFSSNIGAVKIGEMIGAEFHHKMLQAFGFGEKTGIDCPGETAGTLPPYKKWSKIDAGAISFGQGVSVSAIQLTAATSAIANDGILMQPFVVQSVTDQNGHPVKKMQPRKVRRVMSRESARTLNRIMQTVTSPGGTGESAALEGYSVCGKTGTAQKTDGSGTYVKGRYIASFVGFTPADNPAVTIVVVVNEPSKQYYGGIVAGPAFKKIAQETLSYLNIPPRREEKGLTVSREDPVSG
ncbi:MAG: penicillin-binding protein 2 [Desulfobacteraceae bacterium]|nr:MAG: penicillin-binding protein 2 [Desulfobacteraceae bacterium]